MLNSPTGDGEAAERPAWQWIAIGAALVPVLFLPLSMPGLALGATLARSFRAGPLLSALPVLMVLGGSAFAAGALLGRFGRRAGIRGAVLAGALGGVLVLLIAALGRAFSSWTVAFAAATAVIGETSAFSWLGARVARRRGP